MTRSGHRPRRAAGAAGLAALALVAAALPAAAHPSFANSAVIGFAPNPQGGTGAAGQAPPYGAGTSYTPAFRLPDEVDAAFDGKDDNNVDATIVVPAGWTNPACDTAANGFGVRKQVNNASTSATNQPGDIASGWSCSVEDVTTPAGTRKQIHWSGPQATTAADGAQFFLFKVTTPTPTALTGYGQLASALLPGMLAGEGFVSTQTYASGKANPATGQVRVWYPPNDSRATNSGNTAGGLVRTVSPAAGTPGYQTLTAVVSGPPDGTFAMTIPANGGISLTRGANATGPYQFTGTLNRITVTDTRATRPGWQLSGSASPFTNLEADSAKYLGWTPKVFQVGAGAVAGAKVLNALDTTPGPGLASSASLAKATGTYDAGQASVGADLDLKLPRELPAGTYNTTLTVTAI